MQPLISLPTNLVRIKKNDRYLLFNPEIPSWIVTNKNGLRILSVINGKRTLNEIVAIFCKKYGNDYEQNVRNFLIEALKTNFFNKPSSNPRHSVSNFRLRILQLSLTSKCNLNCSYCYAASRVETGNRLLTFEDYKRIITEVKQITPSAIITLTGGEPLLNKDCLKIAEYANNLGFTVQLLTNGTLITGNNVEQISRLFNLVKISIDGADKETHEIHRGQGSYDKIEKVLDLLISHKANYSVGMTVSKLNIKNIKQMTEKYGSHLSFAPLFKAGKASFSKYCITGAEYYKSLSSINTINPLNCCEAALDHAKNAKILKCAMGDAELSISETGDVYPCQLLHHNSFFAGNVLRSSIVDVYNNSIILKKCRGLTVDNIKGCSKCFIKYICGGACRARAFYECGDIHSSGHFCSYEKSAFINGIFSFYSENALC